MKLTAIILAGGKSARMGEDKAWIELEDEPMIQRVINILQPVADQLLIVANHPSYEKLGYPVCYDEQPGMGPLMGIYTGLKHVKTSKNLIVSCDVPYLTVEFLEELIRQAQGCDICIPVKDGQSHQLIGVFSRSCMNSFKKDLDNGHLKLRTAFERLNLKLMDADAFDARIFTNINTRDDLKA
ncbi:MAG: molybdenum cofactor guanylyltransferase [Flavobacteriales bacterium]|nr:molybdenum cofactor guanylyltransferase [Flavobacteriales bacterium]